MNITLSKVSEVVTDKLPTSTLMTLHYHNYLHVYMISNLKSHALSIKHTEEVIHMYVNAIMVMQTLSHATLWYIS